VPARSLSTFAVAAVLSASQATSQLPSQLPSFRSGVDAVQVDVQVTRGGKAVGGLTAANFELRDAGVVQQIQSVSIDDLPLNVMLAFDVSGSIHDQELDDLKKAAHAIVAVLRPVDHVALITFAQIVRLASTWSPPSDEVHEAIERLTSGQRTALYDAASVAIDLRNSVASGRVLMLLLTDGWDTASWTSPLAVIDQVRRSDLVVNVVRVGFRPYRGTVFPARQRKMFFDRPELVKGEFLPAIAAETGGELVDAESRDGIRVACLSVVQSFKSRYVLAYTPTGVPAHGWHPIEVKLKNQRGDVLARRGYDR
jgi:Ca-activated chloride channel homolog